MSRVQEVVYHRYEALSVPNKQIVKYFINIFFIKRYVSAKMTARKFAQIAPSPGFSIPRSKGVTKIDFHDKELINQSVIEANKILANYKSNKDNVVENKSYLRVIASIDDLSLDNPIMKFALDDRLLSGISKYLGVAPQLNSVNVMWSPPSDVTGLSGKWTGSQLFHLDGDSDGIIKVWVLCNRVGEENGPTVLLPADDSYKIGKKIKYHPPQRVLDESIFDSVKQKFVKAIGEPGSVYATDTTRCLHQGSRTAEKSERLAIMLFFDTFRSSWYVTNHNKPKYNYKKLGKDISGLPKRKRQLFAMLADSSKA
jgi:hypothetical protein